MIRNTLITLIFVGLIATSTTNVSACGADQGGQQGQKGAQQGKQGQQGAQQGRQQPGVLGQKPAGQQPPPVVGAKPAQTEGNKDQAKTEKKSFLASLGSSLASGTAGALRAGANLLNPETPAKAKVP